ncbi:MAG TPA: hypothetical protein VHX39_07980, partial [Acetobacteraceae bacterium]|nr:hypothetical protein [Acetobacteraceae bacterium]
MNVGTGPDDGLVEVTSGTPALFGPAVTAGAGVAAATVAGAVVGAAGCAACCGGAAATVVDAVPPLLGVPP